MRGELNQTHALTATFVVVIASFLTATAISRRASRMIDEDATLVQLNASPSLVHLTAARAEVRSVQLQIHDLVEGRSGADPAALHAALSSLDSEARAYLGLPLFPGEQPYWSRVEESLLRFSSSVQHTHERLEAGQRQQAEAMLATQIRPAADHALNALGKATEFNGRNLARLAAEISVARTRSRRLGTVLHLFAAVVAVISAVLLRAVVRRTSELQRAQTQFAEERAQELEAFAGRVAHDITNPLSAAVVAIELALRRLDEPERIRRSLEAGQRGLHNANLIVEGLLDFARAGGQPEPGASADLGQVVQAAMDELDSRARSARVELQVEPMPAEQLACSPGVLGSILSNLVANALKYMGESPRRRVVVRAAVREGAVRVEVEDTGPGLAEGLQAEDVFRMYVRGRGTQQPGLGLGLATVKRLVDAHGGRCGVRARRGEGCQFWFELPRVAAVALGAPAAEVVAATDRA